jgi:hypothetical protein
MLPESQMNGETGALPKLSRKQMAYYIIGTLSFTQRNATILGSLKVFHLICMESTQLILKGIQFWAMYQAYEAEE